MLESEITYKEALAELENILNKLESEDVEIDNLSELVQRASDLVTTCRSKLKATETKLNNTLD